MDTSRWCRLDGCPLVHFPEHAPGCVPIARTDSGRRGGGTVPLNSACISMAWVRMLNSVLSGSTIATLDNYIWDDNTKVHMRLCEAVSVQNI